MARVPRMPRSLRPRVACTALGLAAAAGAVACDGIWGADDFRFVDGSAPQPGANDATVATDATDAAGADANEGSDAAEGDAADAAPAEQAGDAGDASDAQDARPEAGPVDAALDATSECADGGCEACEGGATQCSGNGVQTCSSSGVWGAVVPCSANASCTSGACLGVVSVAYRCGNTAATTEEIQPYLEIQNGSSVAVDLSTLSIRYFFTGDGSSTQAFACDYAQIGCSKLVATFGTFVGTESDHYLQVGFGPDAGSIPAGGTSGGIQARFYDTGYINFTQTNDYSFDATHTSYASSGKITLYQNGTLISGTEP